MIRAHGGYVLLEVLDAPEYKTALVVPETVEQRPALARVLSVGHASKAPVAVGDTVLFDSDRVQCVIDGGEVRTTRRVPVAAPGQQAIVHSADVLAVVER